MRISTATKCEADSVAQEQFRIVAGATMLHSQLWEAHVARNFHESLPKPTACCASRVVNRTWTCEFSWPMRLQSIADEGCSLSVAQNPLPRFARMELGSIPSQVIGGMKTECPDIPVCLFQHHPQLTLDRHELPALTNTPLNFFR